MRKFSHLNKSLGVLEGKCGIYVFLSNYFEVLYVGKSVNLSSRIQTSLSEKLRRKNKISYVSWALTDTKMDASIYELLYIGALKPEINVNDKHDDDLTLDFPPLSFEQPIRVLFPVDIIKPCEKRLRVQKETMFFKSVHREKQVG